MHACIIYAHIITNALLYYFSTSAGDNALPFFPFSNKRQQLDYYLDGVSEAIYISNGFPFGLQTHTMAYVSN